MKLSGMFLILLAGLIAIAIGWMYQSQNKPLEIQSALEIPVDVDYYLEQFIYRVMNQSGSLDYVLRSPYLQHFKHEDISRIDAPTINIYRNHDWQIAAKTAEMLHQQNSLNLIDDVLMQRQDGAFMQIINADKAAFDLAENIYTLTNIRATYYHAKR